MVQFIERIPTMEEYRRLCIAVGWENGINFAIAPQSLPKSLYAVVAEIDGQAVGMGRIVGDGVMYFYCQDIVVEPDYQGQGIGRQLVEHLLRYIKSQAHGPVFVGLFSTQMAKPLYESFGFKMDPYLEGMYHVVVGE